MNMALNIFDYGRGGNSSVQKCTTVSAITVTAKAIFKRLYLVAGLSNFGPRVNCSCAPTPPPLIHQLSLDFGVNYFPQRPIFVITILQVLFPGEGSSCSST